MPVTLKTTSSTYRVKDESGYEFELVTNYDTERDPPAWEATVYLGAFGMATEQAAISKAIVAARQFLRIAEDSTVGPCPICEFGTPHPIERREDGSKVFRWTCGHWIDSAQHTNKEGT